MRAMFGHWLPRVCVLAATLACRAPIPPDAATTLPHGDQSVWREAPPAPVTLGGPRRVKAGPAMLNSPEAEPILPSGPTCPLLCSLVAQNCRGADAQWASEDECLAACRQADWAAGDAGSAKGNTLACRVTWAQATSDAADTCRNAGPFSPSCIDGVEVPVVRVPERGAGSCVLGLYDSTDGASWGAGRRARDVILGRRVDAVTRHAGKSLRIVDVAQGLPADDELRDCDFVVTAFYDATLTDAVRYAAWLTAVLRSGRQVAILGDYGAYQDAATQEYLSHEVVNLPLSLLGVAYGAQWTNDAKLLRVASRERAVFSSAPNLKSAGHFLQFTALSGDVTPLLEVQRTDVPGPPSAVAFVSPRGGMILTRYYEDKGGRELAGLSAFLSRAGLH